jgi:hypothetical protein
MITRLQFTEAVFPSRTISNFTRFLVLKNIVRMNPKGHQFIYLTLAEKQS